MFFINLMMRSSSTARTIRLAQVVLGGWHEVTAVRFESVRIRKKTMRGLVVEDQRLFSAGLKLWLESHFESCHISLAEDGPAAMVVLDKGDTDLVLLDWELQCQCEQKVLRDKCAQQVLREIRSRHAKVPVVVVSGDQSPSAVCSVLDEGASGFVTKAMDPKLILMALRLIASGGEYWPHDHEHRKVIQPLPTRSIDETFPGLTPRQCAVLERLNHGLSNKQIARDMGITETTVKVHLRAAFRALDVHSRTEAMCALASAGVAVA